MGGGGGGGGELCSDQLSKILRIFPTRQALNSVISMWSCIVSAAYGSVPATGVCGIATLVSGEAELKEEQWRS